MYKETEFRETSVFVENVPPSLPKTFTPPAPQYNKQVLPVCLSQPCTNVPDDLAGEADSNYM
jgi:hypothetical protein